MTIARVFADPPICSDITTDGLIVRTFRTPGQVVRALALLRWEAGMAAVVDLNLHGLLGREVVAYIGNHCPGVGIWGITSSCARDWPVWATAACRRVLRREDVGELLRSLGSAEGRKVDQTERVAAEPSCPPDSKSVA